MKSFVKQLINALFTSTALVIVILIFFFLSCSTIGLFIFIHYAGNTVTETLDGLPYHETNGIGYTTDTYIDLTDLGVDPLKYGHYSFRATDLPFFKHTTEIISEVDNLVSPDKQYILHYDIWRSSIPFILDIKEHSLLKDSKKAQKSTYDYGSHKAYWLDNGEFLIRYDDNHILLFRANTTKELIDSNVCAEFIKNNMTIPPVINFIDLIFSKPSTSQKQ